MVAYCIELVAKGRNDASPCLFQTDEKPAHLHLAFSAETREQVDAFYRAALEAVVHNLEAICQQG